LDRKAPQAAGSAVFAVFAVLAAADQSSVRSCDRLNLGWRSEAAIRGIVLVPYLTTFVNKIIAHY
jgi:hypothetical protein